MRETDFYKSIIFNSIMGYAYYKVICNKEGDNLDYELIELNFAYESILGIKASEAIGKRSSEIGIYPYGDDFGKLFSTHTNQDYKVNSFSPEKNYLVILLSECFNKSIFEKTTVINRLQQIEEELTESKSKLVEANKMLQTVLDTIPMPVFWKNKDAVFLGCNKLFALDAGKMYPSEIIGDTDYNMLWKEQADLYRQDDFKIMETGLARINYEEHHNSKEGNCTWVRSCKIPLIDEAGNVYGVMGSYEDITDRKLSEQALNYEKERLKITLHSIGDGVIATDSDGKVVLENSVAAELTGWSQEEAQGREIREIFNIVNQDTRIPCENPVEKVVSSGKIVGLPNHTLLISRNGKEFIIDDSAAPIKNIEGNIEGVVLVFRDVTEKSKRDKEIVYLNYHDSLTGLYNRRFLEEELNRLDVESMLPLSIIMGDVNGLKLTNDVFGHLEGDKLLKTVADKMTLCCGTKDIIARWGGDEFIILMPQTSEKKAKEICKKINIDCSLEDSNKIRASISLGYSVKVDLEQEVSIVLKKAEDAMYKNKYLETRSFRSSIITSIKNTLFEKSQETEEHAERLKQISLAIGARMEFSETELHELELLAVLHDIGKIAISDSILNKLGPLTDEEWIEMKKHPEIGYRIALSVPELSQVADYIFSHHERFDGMGYPRGLRGEEIPLMSRIVAISDSYDAMTSDRSYRKAMPIEAALKEILKNSGTQFDPEVVKIFMGLLSNNTVR